MTGSVDGPSRFTVHQQPPMLPGCCFICKSANDSPFVDTGLSLPFEGTVYVGKACLTEMYNKVDPTEDYTREQVIMVRDEVRELARTELSKLLDRVRDAVNDTRTRISLGSATIFPDAFDVSFPDLEDDDSAEGIGLGNEPDFTGDERQLDSVNVEGDGVVGEQGPDDVPSDSGDGNVGADGNDNRDGTVV